MMGSLSSLVENQKKEMATMEEGFPKFCEAFYDRGYDRDTKAFLLKKNEFPYEWLDSYDKLLWSACGDHATEEPCGLCKESSESAQCRNTSSSTSSVVAHSWLMCLSSSATISRDTHKLNPLFFYGAPSLSYNVMLYKFRSDGNVHPVLLS